MPYLAAPVGSPVGRRELGDLGVTPSVRSPRVPAVSEPVSARRTPAVGTDGSESSLRAASNAGAGTVRPVAVMGPPVGPLPDAVRRGKADLLGRTTG